MSMSVKTCFRCEKEFRSWRNGGMMTIAGFERGASGKAYYDNFTLCPECNALVRKAALDCIFGKEDSDVKEDNLR